MEHFDAIIIGSGQGGTPLSKALADSGLHTALVERKHIGGTCINEGCTPTKTMVSSARVAALARRGADYGVHTGNLQIDMERVRQRKREIVDSFRAGSQAGLEKTANLELIFADATFTGPHTLAVGNRTLTADKIFISAGARPDLPDNIAGPYLDSTTIMELDVVPEHLVVLGGGYVGLEFGQMFRRFGSRVTIVHRGSQLLTREDPDVAEEVAKILREDGLEIQLNSNATPTGSHLLIATGRTPNTASLNLPAAGIETNPKGFIAVDERLETNVKGVFAMGDIKGGPAFTHIAYDDFRILRANILEHGHATTTNRYVPYTVYIDPQLGRVGMTETEAKARNLDFKVYKMPMSHVARALETDETRGFLKALVDKETQQILGAAILGIEGGEIMTMLQLAMMGNLPYTTLRDATFAHPTLAESLNNLFS